MDHGNSICGLKDCIPLLKGVALVTSSMFAGIAIYINAVDQPSRLNLNTENALASWRESYKRAAPIQASLALISSASSLLTYASIRNAICQSGTVTGNATAATNAVVKVTKDTLGHCCKCKGLGWLLSGLLIGSVVPITLLVILPTNKQLLDEGRDRHSDDTRQLIVKWGELHAIRTVLSVAATSVLFCKIFKHAH